MAAAEPRCVTEYVSFKSFISMFAAGWQKFCVAARAAWRVPWGRYVRRGRGPSAPSHSDSCPSVAWRCTPEYKSTATVHRNTRAQPLQNFVPPFSFATNEIEAESRKATDSNQQMCVFTNWDQNNETVTDALHKLNIHMRQAYLTHKFYQILEQCLQLCILDEAIVILK